MTSRVGLFAISPPSKYLNKMKNKNNNLNLHHIKRHHSQLLANQTFPSQFLILKNLITLGFSDSFNYRVSTVFINPKNLEKVLLISRYSK